MCLAVRHTTAKASKRFHSLELTGTMRHARFHCLAVTLVLYGLLLQSCRSGLRAIIEMPAARQEHPTTDDHVQASGEFSSSGTLAAPHADALFEGVSDSVSPAEPAAMLPVLAAAPVPETPSFAAVHSAPQSFTGLFTASSGERVLLGQCRGRWQALLSPGSKHYGHQHMLPVVGSGDIEASLKALRGQDVWSSRSRIHVLSTPHTPSTPYIYVGKLGLLGGSPAQQARSPIEVWRIGPTLVLHGDAASKAVYHIPSGYRYKGHRLKVGSVIQRACLTLHYVAANNEAEYLRLAVAQNAYTAAPMLGANVGQVVTVDTLEGGVSDSYAHYHKDRSLQRMKHAGLVLYGSVKKNKMCCQKSSIDVQVEILVEKIEEAYSASDDEQIAKIRREHVKVPHQQATAFEETDENPVASPAAPAAGISSADCLASLHALPVPSPVFGARDWARYFGEVGEEPFLPSDIGEILDSPCPFWPGKAVKDSHLLVLIPATVDGDPFSLNLLGELVRRPSSGGHPTGYQLYSSIVQEAFGTQSPARSYWVLMTRDVLSGSRNATYTDQQALVTACAGETGLSYELPNALEAATVILSYYVCSGERLYSDVPWTYTRCQELVDDQSPVIVGGFTPEGIDVDYYLDVYFRHYGVAICRKF